MKKTIVVLIMVFGVVGLFSLVALAKSDKVNAQSNESDKKIKEETVDLDSVDSLADGNGKAVKIKTKNAGEEQNLKNTIKGDDESEIESEEGTEKGNSKMKNSSELKGFSKNIIKSLKTVAEDEPVVAEKLTELAKNKEKNQNKIVAAVEKIENKGSVKSFIVGTDYKNLGQLRNSIVQNQNQIKDLTQLISQVQGNENRLILQEQLKIMVAEREAINALIKEEEDSFSLFGWAFKLMNGYSDKVVDVESEIELDTEVQEALIVIETEVVEDINIVK